MLPGSWRRVVAGAGVAAVAFGVGMSVGQHHQSPAGRDSVGDVVDEAAARIEQEAATPVDRATLERAAVQGMLRALDDRWSTYYAPGELGTFSSAMDGRYSGVGLWLRMSTAGTPVVTSVRPGSSAAAAGLRQGDVLLAVGGRPTSGGSLTDAVSRLRGEPGSTVTLTLSRDGRRQLVRLVRSQMGAPAVTVDRRDDGVLVLHVASMSRGVGRQVRAALAVDPTVRRTGVVLDLRGNGGGYVDEAVEVAGAFLDGGPVVTLQRRDAGPLVLDAGAPGDTTTPVVVLVDGGTASAAEIVAAALQDRNRAVVMGGRTFGKGSVQEPTRLSDGSALEFTVGRYLTPSGRALDGVGIDPDLHVAGNDPRLMTWAVEVLTGLTASAGSGAGAGAG